VAIDLAGSIVTLLVDQWIKANTTRLITPIIDRDAELEAWNAPQRICVREMQSTHRVMDLANAVQEVTRMYQADLYALDRDDALDMRTEVDRIINANNNDPFNGVVFIVQGKWEDLTGSSGNYFRYTCTLQATSYANA